MPTIDGRIPARARLFSPRQFVTLDEAHAALNIARRFIDAGNPVFVARPATDRRGEWAPNWGTGGSGYWLPKEWETTPVDQSTLRRFRHGDALAMVTGHAFDVLDVDPRNGGLESFETLRGLGLIPSTVAKAATPSGGAHLFIPTLRVRKTKRDGIDLQAGVDGEGHGFVWIAPTVRRSKADNVLRPYRWVEQLTSAGVGGQDDSAGALVDWFRATEPTTSTADLHHWNGNTEQWLTEHTTGATVSPVVQRVLLPYINGAPFDGHSRMLKFQIHLVRLAAEGHNGVPEALTFARTAWLDTPHTSDEDPAQEWDVALDHAIQNYGGTTR